MEKLIAILGIITIISGVYLLSPNKDKINKKSVLVGLLGQIIMAFLLIKTPLWKGVEWLSGVVTDIINYANEGIIFVFGDLASSQFSLFLSALMPIVFVSSVLGILFHFGILQKLINLISKTVAKLFNIDAIVATNAISNMILGQSESLFVTKSYLNNVSDSVIFATLVGGMTSISASIVSLYTGFGASMEWILISMPLTVFGAITLLQLYMPTKHNSTEDLIIEADTGSNFLETAMIYAQAGFKSVVGVAVALMVFISLVALVNGLLPGTTLQGLIAIPFKPIAFLMGVSPQEVNAVAEILATKLVLNEAVAFGLPTFAMLSVKAKAMMTITLCGFAGWGSIGILVGTYTAVAPSKVSTVAKLGIQALLLSTFVNILSGTMIGLFL